MFPLSFDDCTTRPSFIDAPVTRPSSSDDPRHQAVSFGRQMGMFREAVAWMRGFIGMQPGMFLLGFIMMGAFKDQPMVPAPGSSCNADDRRIGIWLTYLFMMTVCSVLSTHFVWGIVGAEAEARSRAFRLWRLANENVMKKEPEHGIAGIAGWKGKAVRPCFCLAVAFSFGSWVCNFVTLYLFLKQQAGCVNGSPEIIPFAVVGVLAILVHGFLGWVATTQD